MGSPRNASFLCLGEDKGVCADGRLQVIKEKILWEVGGSVGALVTVDIWSGRYIKDSFIAATIHYVGDGSLKNAFMGLKRLNRRHDPQTTNRGYLKILNSVSVNEPSIYRVITDSGENVVCTFKNEYEVLHGETGNAGCEEVTAVSISSDEDDNASTCSDGDLFGSGEDEIDDFEEEQHG
ncbi:hypothetical protein Tcan_14839 [Toxocara canis]|uniref:Uncharacterized protein n=1 Tax=Toxocara canis TaxID=6265 RepID=A0A0B2VM10_TOXCA|nr:hypothetical protein Tcan_14839 [Toxocara canis]